MKDVIQRICELQPGYSPTGTPEMRERGRLIRRDLVEALRSLSGPLSAALGRYGSDLKVDASDGIGLKTELPWVRFCSESMSPRPTKGFYCMLHFATDGSAVFVTIGCGSSQFRNGSFVTLPDTELAERTAWARQVVLEALGSTEPFNDPPEFGARRPLPKSFERATALARRIAVGDLETTDLTPILLRAAEFLSLVYQAETDGRALSPADQVELEIERAVKPLSTNGAQGLRLSSADRKMVELRAMHLVREWLEKEGYQVTDTSATRPYDFEAVKDGEALKVEVKGTTSDNVNAILMTHNEVQLHRCEKGSTALFIVSAVRLQSNGSEREAVGGELESLLRWDIDAWALMTTAYRVERPRA